MQKIYKFYNIILAIFLFSLPLSEGIKQISLVLFILLGFYIIFKEKKTIKLDLINITLLVFTFATIISCIVTQVNIKLSYDVIRCSLFFIVLRCIGIEKINFKYMLYSLFVGFIATFIIGCIVRFNSVDPNYVFELKSIGNVNHSAIFMILISNIALCCISNKYDVFLRYLAILATTVSLVGIFLTGSRATMYLSPLIIIATLLYLNITKELKIKYTISLLIILSSFIVIVIYNIPDSARIYQKILKGITANETRYPIFFSAFYTWQENPIFGIGSGNFKTIDITHFFPGNFEERVSHAHNTFLTFLTEKGLVATIGYILFQISLFTAFLKNIKKSNIFFLSLMILLINNIISMANTTFHHENALLMLFIWAYSINLIDNSNIRLNKQHL